MILHRNCEGTEQLRLFLMSRLSNDVSVKNMSSDLLSGQTLNRGSEEQTVSNRSLSTHCSICRLITGTRCIIPCKGKSQPSGAVGMVEMALERLNENNVVELDEERKAAMVSNLLVVLCGNHDAQPIVNSGSLY